jgi:CRISPR type IV-associated protein Csf1
MFAPTLGDERTEDGSTLPTVSNLPTRAQMRDWLLNPPVPPFTIAIAESGQKHILPWAQEGHSRDYFPVQFELDSLWIDRAQFTTLIDHYEALMGLGFSKTEIDSGQYHSDRLMKALNQYGPHDAVVAPYRGGRLLALCSHVAQLGEPCPHELFRH